MEIIQNLCPESKYDIKCPYTMQPEGITIHNTANDASANNEIAYMIRNDNKVSFHYAVDDIRAVQGIPLDRCSWNAGDGINGYGNRKTIAIEICYSLSGGDRFIQAEKNCAELIARLMLQYGWGVDRIGTKYINTHQYRSGKYCPHRTLDMGIGRFYDMIKAKYYELSPEPQPVPPEPTPTEDINIGDEVLINGDLYTNSNADKPAGKAINKRTYITRIANGAKHPYNTTGDLGWMDRDSITLISDSKPATLAIGTRVRTIATGNGASDGSSVSAMRGLEGTISRIIDGAKYPYLINDNEGPLGWYQANALEII